MANSLGTVLRDEVMWLLGPVIAASQSPRGASLLLRGLGYTDVVAERDDTRAAIARLIEAASAIEAAPTDDLATWSGIQRILQQIAALGDAIEALGTSGLETLGRELGEQLVAVYLRGRVPWLFRVASLLTLIDPAEAATPAPLLQDGAAIVRVPRRRDRLQLHRARDLVSAPLATLATAYLPNDLAAAADAHAAGARLFEPLLRLAGALGLFAHIDLVDTEPPEAPGPPPDSDADWPDSHGGEVDPDEGTTDPPPVPPPDVTAFLRRFQPRLLVAIPMPDGAPAQVGVAVTASSAEHPEHVRGFVVSLVGTLALAHERGPWQLELNATGDVPAFVLGPGGVMLAPAAGANPDAAVHLALRRHSAAGEPAFVLGAAQGTRIELGSLVVGVDAALHPDRSAIELSIDTAPSALVLAPGDGDGLLRRVLSREVRINLDAGLVLSSDGGLRLKGGVGLDARTAASVSIGPVTLADPRLSLSVSGAAIRLAASCDLALDLGPVTAVVSGIGLALEARLAESQRWPAALDAAFVPPAGAGIAISSPLISGGGFLAREAGRYLGSLALSVGAFHVAGAGVLETRMPDGSDGFSLAAIASARFPSIQLGWGFTLDGLGAFVGVHRTVDADAMRAGLRDGAVAALLGGGDPVTDAPAIVASLGKLFPARQGRFVVGPTARIGWGTPALLQADLAILLELPGVPRIVVLAAVQVGLPTLEHRIVDLRMDVLGVLDLARKTLAVDASLHDSTLAGYALTGDMALRTSWSDQPYFLLAIGGFHPRFTPPAGFPTLRRVALTIGDNPRLQLQAYLALTSSTLQLGGRVDLSYRAGGLSIGGHLRFDALIDLRPLHLEVELEAKVSIKYRGHNIASAKLEFLLVGPRPWRAHGTATIGILWWDVSVGFDVTWGDRTPPELPPPPDVAGILRAALRDLSAWSSELAAGERGWLVLRDDLAPDVLRMHPLASLIVRQRAVPLGLHITAFGTVPLAEPLRFAIAGAGVAASPVATEPTYDMFAPAQFAALRSDERLAAPSFEPMTSGARLQSAVKLGAVTRARMDHDTAVTDPLAPPRRPAPTQVTPTLLAAASPQRRPSSGRIRVHPPRFVLASTRDLAITARGAQLAAGQTGYAALREARRAGGGADLQIVPRAETTNARSRVVVVREDERSRNIDFVDTVTGAAMTRAEFVQEINAGRYPGYAVRRVRGIDTPVSRPTPTTDDNLG